MEMMEDFKAEIESRKAAWQKKAREEAMKTWQPAMDKATDELVKALDNLIDNHSKKLKVIRQALLTTTSDTNFVDDLILDETEAAAARVTRHCEEYLEKSLSDVGSDRQLVTLRDPNVDRSQLTLNAPPARSYEGYSNGKTQQSRDLFKFPRFESPNNEGFPQGALSTIKSWVR